MSYIVSTLKNLGDSTIGYQDEQECTMAFELIQLNFP